MLIVNIYDKVYRYFIKFESLITNILCFVLYNEMEFLPTTILIHFLRVAKWKMYTVYNIQTPIHYRIIFFNKSIYISAKMPPKKKVEEEEKVVIIGRLGTNLKCGIVGKHFIK